MVPSASCFLPLQVKCAQYWPSTTSTPEVFEEFEVKLNKEEQCPDYIIRLLTLSNVSLAPTAGSVCVFVPRQGVTLPCEHPVNSGHRCVTSVLNQQVTRGAISQSEAVHSMVFTQSGGRRNAHTTPHMLWRGLDFL